FPESPSINNTVRSNFYPHYTSQTRLNFSILSLSNLNCNQITPNSGSYSEEGLGELRLSGLTAAVLATSKDWH
ncbi:hypothetical protein LEMLEM_LOCUS22562, partial [Lemmus lemmus]